MCFPRPLKFATYPRPFDTGTAIIKDVHGDLISSGSPFFGAPTRGGGDEDNGDSMQELDSTGNNCSTNCFNKSQMYRYKDMLLFRMRATNKATCTIHLTTNREYTIEHGTPFSKFQTYNITNTRVQNVVIKQRLLKHSKRKAGKVLRSHKKVKPSH